MKNPLLFPFFAVCSFALLTGCTPDKSVDSGALSNAAKPAVAANAPAGIPAAARPEVEEQMKRAQEEAKRAEQEASARNATQEVGEK